MENEEIDRAARALYADAVPSENLRARILAVAAAAAPGNVSPPPPQLPRRFAMMPPLAWGAAATMTACVILTAVSLLTPGTPLHPTPAFAEVEGAMERVRTLRWVEYLRLYRPDGSLAEEGAAEKWYRNTPLPPNLAVPERALPRDLQAISMIALPLPVKPTKPGVRKSVPGWLFSVTADGYVSYSNTRRWRELSDKGKERVRARRRAEEAVAGRTWVAVPLGSFLLPPHSTRWQQSSGFVRHQPSLLFTRTLSEPWRGQKGGSITFRLWTDPKTRRLQRRETRVDFPDGHRLLLTSQDYCYQVPIPDCVFTAAHFDKEGPFVVGGHKRFCKSLPLGAGATLRR